MRLSQRIDLSRLLNHSSTPASYRSCLVNWIGRNRDRKFVAAKIVYIEETTMVRWKLKIGRSHGWGDRQDGNQLKRFLLLA